MQHRACSALNVKFEDYDLQDEDFKVYQLYLPLLSKNLMFLPLQEYPNEWPVPGNLKLARLTSKARGGDFERRGGDRNGNGNVCDYCNKSGHTAGHCKAYRSANGSTRMQNAFCSHCQIAGHTPQSCFKLHPNLQNQHHQGGNRKQKGNKGNQGQW